MAKLVWDTIGDRKYEIGVDHGVIYPQNAAGAYQKGEAWSGLTAVNSSPSGADANKTYADNIYNRHKGDKNRTDRKQGRGNRVYGFYK